MHALSWEQVAGIAARFAALNPYDLSCVPGSILKIEDDNFDPKTGKQRQLWCYAIAAKRHALFLKDREGCPTLLRRGVNNKEDRCSEHGLGHLLNPTDPLSEDRAWIAQVWLRIIRKAIGLRTRRFPFEDRPAMARLTVSSMAVMRAFEKFNNAKPYRSQIKPFNFMLTCHVRRFGFPLDADAEHFHLVAPYELDPRKWVTLPWVDQYSLKRFRITTRGEHGTRGVARVKTYGDVLREYEYHPEAKCADADGRPCSKQTTGLLQRRYVRIDGFRFIGKESNRLEEVEAGTVHDPHSVYTEYLDKRRDEWTTKTLPVLKAMPMPWLQKRSGLDRSTLQAIRAGRLPHPRNRSKLSAIARESQPPINS